jgi:hypothetical protein
LKVTIFTSPLFNASNVAVLHINKAFYPFAAIPVTALPVIFWFYIILTVAGLYNVRLFANLDFSVFLAGVLKEAISTGL